MTLSYDDHRRIVKDDVFFSISYDCANRMLNTALLGVIIFGQIEYKEMITYLISKYSIPLNDANRIISYIQSNGYGNLLIEYSKFINGESLKDTTVE